MDTKFDLPMRVLSKGALVERLMSLANQDMHGYGVEYLYDRRVSRPYFGNCILAYVNVGDPHRDTLLYDTITREFSIGSWGDWLEAYEAEHGQTVGY